MQPGDFLKVTVGWTVPSASEPVLNVWDFECTAFDSPTELQIVGEYIAAQFVAIYITPILPVLSNQVGATTISLRNYADITEGWDGSDLYGTGQAGSALLPPFVTFSIKAQRTNYALRNGRKGIPGAAAGSLSTVGRVAEGTIDILDEAIETWHETWYVEAGENTIAFVPRIVRDPATPGVNPTIYSPISAFTLNRSFGSQNSRK